MTTAPIFFALLLLTSPYQLLTTPLILISGLDNIFTLNQFYFNMKNVLFLSLFFLIAAASNAHSQTNKDTQQLRYLKEVEWPKAYREQDTVLLDRILAAEFQLIDASGAAYSKKDELAYIKANRPSYKSFRFEITRLDIFENQIAIISGIGHLTGTDDKGAYKSTYSSSNVLIKRGKLWKAISSHVSGIKTIYDDK